MRLKIYLLLITILFGILLLSYYLINNIEGFNKYNLKIVPIKPCGCEITNLNLADTNYYLDNDLVKYLEFLMAKYGFILIRNQGKINNEKNIKGKYLTGKEQCIFSKNFGTKRLHSPHAVHDEAPNNDIFRLSNNEKHGFNSVGPEWHNDGSFEKNPFSYVIYHIIKAPEGYGNTMFAHLGEAYDKLDNSLKNRLENCASINSNSNVIHPLVHKHPISNRKSLYLHLGMTGAIIENVNDKKKYKKTKFTDEITPYYLPKYIKNINDLKNIRCWRNKEMNKFFINISNLLDDKEVSYSHKWKEGDIIIIDNLAVAHKATKQAHDLKKGLRILHRTTVESNKELKPIKELQLEKKLDLNQENPFGKDSTWINGYVGYRWGDWKNRSIPH